MIKNIDGAMLRNMYLHGARMLETNKELVDSLNVFPVPDGDTGSNMFLTISSAVKEVNAVAGDDVKAIATAFARGALRGARGNSGVILSQIFKGISNGIDACEGPVTVKAFAKALRSGTEVAYHAVTKPKEGTILTVIRVVSEFAYEKRNKYTDFVEFMQAVIHKGVEILNQTPDMLPVLKKAGVVDAGGKGLLFIFEGFLNALLGKDLPEKSETAETSSVDMSEAADIHDLENIEFAYCTEFFIVNLKPKVTEADIDKLRDEYLKLGDCVIVIGDLSFVKVHIHNNCPGRVLQAALKLGELDKIKIENMLQQNRELMAAREAEKKDFGMIAVCAGKGLSDIFRDIMVDKIIEGGQTMNPSVDDIVSAVKAVNAKEVFIFPNNKNIILAAETAKEITDKPLHVIKTTDIPEGISAVLAFNPEASVEENIENMTEAAKSVKSAQVTYAVRTTSLDGFDLKEGDVIGLAEGAIKAKGKTAEQVTMDLVDKLVDDMTGTVMLYYGEGVTEDECDKLIAKLAEKYEDIDFAGHFGGQPHYYYFIAIE